MYKIVERHPGTYEIDGGELTRVLVPHGNKLLAEQICHAMNHGVRTIDFNDGRAGGSTPGGLSITST